MPKFVEFFAGGGCARLGLGDAWSCVLANDFSREKVETYRANFGTAEMCRRDIREINDSDVPKAALWWASFPCQDHSIAGRGLGFEGQRGSLVFEVIRLLNAAVTAGTAPRLIAFENVVGFLGAAEGRDFASVITALVSAGYGVGAVMLDAKDFVPQSRQRMIIVATRHDVAIPCKLIAKAPTAKWHTNALRLAVSRLPATVLRHWH